ncbi:MAG TPA: isocitrate lyase/phosphoenolpyruvate mutase family protein [Ohtaekwangia sp.]|uniref:isocitrate lyase/PEP mutase family protein n=1 Tax=Ohtaekwangia sp. TaxID=2066019 RepID=UPI002F94B999
MSTFQKFKALHASNELLVLPNAWDARSAIVFEQYGFPAVATSSAAVANSLGYEDGENMSFEDYLFVIRRILSSIHVPLTVDIETGYSADDDAIADNVLHLADLGVAGINIEDSVIHGAERSLTDAALFARTISHIKKRLKSRGIDLFVNIRCDCYILNVENKQQETIRRLKLYNPSGADGIFVPCIQNESDIAEVAASSSLPLNVMCIPGLPDLDTLNRLGVKRVSMGPFMFHKVYAGISTLSKAIVSSRSFTPILS